MPISKDKTSVLMYLDKELKIELEKLAKEDGRSFNGYVTNLLNQHVKNIKKTQE